MLLACNVNDFIKYQELVTERKDLLSAMRRRFDWTGWPPIDEDVERVYELDVEILEAEFD